MIIYKTSAMEVEMRETIKHETRFHVNRLQTFSIIWLMDRLTEGKMKAKTLSFGN